MNNNLINSKAESIGSIPSSISIESGLQNNKHQVNVEIQISNEINKMPKYPFEFVAKIGGTSLTKLRKQ